MKRLLVFLATVFATVSIFAGSTGGPVLTSGGTGLTADSVLESHLKAVDSAVDEECLTYESTTGDFEWQSCAGTETNDLEGNPPPTIADTEVLIGTGAGTAAFSVVSGDVTLANNGAVTIGADKILESHLKAVDAAVDEECLTYESTTGDFEWQSCAGTETNDLEGSPPPNVADTEIYIGTGAGTGAWSAVSGDATLANTGALTIAANSVALTTDTTGNYAAGDGEAGNALTGDTATAFFSAGTIEHERGGLQADVNAYSGIVGIEAGSTLEINTSAEVATAIDDETGTGVIVYGTSPTIATPSLTMAQGAAPTPTAEGDLQWETDDDHILVGDGVDAVEFVPTEDVSGDITMTTAGATSLATDSVSDNEIDYTNVTGADLTLTDAGAITSSGTITATVGFDCVGASDCDYGSVDITDHTFVTDGTGTAEFVIPAGSIDSTEILDATILEVDLKAVDAAADEDFLTYESTTGDFEWHSASDVADSIAGAISEGSLTNDSIVEADLKAVDAAADEECLTYETATGDFEWQACGGGEWTDTGSIVHLNEETVDELVIGGTTEAGADIFLGVDGAAVFNEQGNDVDFRIEGASNANALFVDATTNAVSLGSDEASLTLAAATIDSRLSTHLEDGEGLEAEYAGHRHSATAGNGAVFYGSRSRGTEGSETAVQSGDLLTQFTAIGHDGTDYNLSASIKMKVDTTPGANDMPGQISFETTADGANTLTEAMRIDSGQFVLVLHGLDGIGAVDMDYGSADITDHTFTTDGTGTTEFVIPAGSIDSTEILDATILEVDLKAVDAAADEDFLTYESTTGDFEWHSASDVADSIAGAISEGALTDASIVEADLKAVDAAADEECLTYEVTTGDFEWQACGGAETNDLEATAPPTIADTEILIGTGAGTAAFAAVSGDATLANTGALTIAANSVALTTDTTGNYAAGDGEAGNALTGDTATAFFSAGTIEHERGGLEADASAYDGLIGITGGATYNQTGTTTQIVIFDGAGAPTSAALSGDVTMTNGGVVTIGNDKILEAHLKAVDAAADEECLTYESTTGDFEWQSCGGGGSSEVQTFTSSGTWTKPASGSFAMIEAWGGGGGGDATDNDGAGGGGGYNRRYMLLSALGATETVTIGAGGTAANPGNAGGTTTFGSHLSAYGGAGGGPTDGGGGGGPAGAGSGRTPGAPTMGISGTGYIQGEGGEGGAGSFGAGGHWHGGGGGSSDNGSDGGSSVYGGGGGGGGSAGGGSGGASIYGGAGGDGDTAGTQPGGGGGDTAAGAAGQVKVTVW